jgi:hypothetical protein
MIKPETLDEHPDFSLVLGGPLFQLYRRAHLSGAALELVRRRVLVISCVAWLPLLMLSLIEGHALGGTIKVPFLYDIEAHVRFLVALPILIAAELSVHLRIRVGVQQFVERGIIVSEDIPKYHAAIDSALSFRNSVTAEIALLILVYILGHWVWRSQTALGAASWYAILDGTALHLTLAGYWYIFVSLPIFQFILLRWYLRFLLWFWFLWRVSRLNLYLNPTHPDRAAGLGFLGTSTYAFSPILVAQGALLAGLIANQIFYAGQNLESFKVQIAGFLTLFVAVVLSPLTVFAPQLARAKRQGLGEYGLLGSRYVEAFKKKWVHGDSTASDELLGTGDIQALADLGNSYAIIQETRLVPFGPMHVTRLAAVTAAPLLPLVLTMFSLEELVTELIKTIF